MKNILLTLIISLSLLCCGPGNNISGGSEINSKPAYGIDISKYQGNIADILNRKTDSLDFIICKATEGVNTTDLDFVSNWRLIDSGGFTRGCYHFYHCNDNITEQVNYYINTVGQFAKTDLPPIVDFEEGSILAGYSGQDIQKGLLNFLNCLKQKTGRIPIVYTDNNTADKYLSDSLFSDYPLWIANPSKAKNPVVPSLWKSKGWAIWQKSWKYVAVMKDTTDFDVFNGDAKALNEFIQSN